MVFPRLRKAWLNNAFDDFRENSCIHTYAENLVIIPPLYYHCFKEILTQISRSLGHSSQFWLKCINLSKCTKFCSTYKLPVNCLSPPPPPPTHTHIPRFLSPTLRVINTDYRRLVTSNCMRHLLVKKIFNCFIVFTGQPFCPWVLVNFRLLWRIFDSLSKKLPEITNFPWKLWFCLSFWILSGLLKKNSVLAFKFWPT